MPLQQQMFLCIFPCCLFSLHKIISFLLKLLCFLFHSYILTHFLAQQHIQLQKQLSQHFHLILLLSQAQQANFCLRGCRCSGIQQTYLLHTCIHSCFLQHIPCFS